MDYNLGTARGVIELAYDGKGAEQARQDIDKTDKASSGAVAKWAKRATAAGAAVTAAFVIKGGIDRLTAIDDAEGKLRGLGYTAGQVEGIMENALAAVKGTAFGMGDAATAAASALAAGVKQGPELEAYLSTIGDAATITGRSFVDMGSLINKVTTNGRLKTQEMNTMMDAGLPILQWLAKQYGVNAEEMRKMVTAGKVDAETFRKVLNDNIGGAALESGNTFRGAMANLKASLGRIGANLLGPIFKQLTGGMGDATKALSGIEDAAKPIGEALGKAFGIGLEAIRAILKVVGPIMEFLGEHNEILLILISTWGAYKLAVLGMAAATKVLAAYRRIVAAVTTAQGIMNLVMAANPFALIVALIVGVIVALVLLWQRSETFRNIVIGVWEAVKGAVQAVADWFSGPFVDGVMAVWNTVTGFFDSAGQAISNAMNWIKDTISSAWNSITTFTSTVWGAITSFFQSFWQSLINIFGPPIRTAQSIITGAWNAIRNVTSTVWGAVAGVVSRIVGRIVSTVSGIYNRVVGIFKSAGTWLYNSGKEIIQGLINGITSMVGKITGAVKGVAGFIGKFIPGSPVQEGPLRVLNRGHAGKQIVKMIIDGIEAEEAAATASARSFASSVERALATLSQADPVVLRAASNPGPIQLAVPAPAGAPVAVAAPPATKEVTYDIDIVNPAPEPASDSIFRSAQKVAYLGLGEGDD